jgi:hypothetical protein
VSFLIDPPLLYASGRTYAQSSPPNEGGNSDALVGATTMALFWGVSVSLYLDRPWTRPIWRLCRASSGRDWMLNSGVLRLDWRRAGLGTHVVSTAIFATYPVWLWLGIRDGRRASAGHGP